MQDLRARISKAEPWWADRHHDLSRLFLSRPDALGSTATPAAARHAPGVKCALPSAHAAILATLYAGPRKLRSTEDRYQASDWTIWRTDSVGRGPLLRYPFTPGRTWTVKKGRRQLTYSIESDSAEITVAAGRFRGCLKVREATKGFDSWRFDYYCPYVGRALTTVAGRDYENRNTELLSYQATSR